MWQPRKGLVFSFVDSCWISSQGQDRKSIWYKRDVKNPSYPPVCKPLAAMPCLPWGSWLLAWETKGAQMTIAGWREGYFNVLLLDCQLQPAWLSFPCYDIKFCKTSFGEACWYIAFWRELLTPISPNSLAYDCLKTSSEDCLSVA